MPPRLARLLAAVVAIALVAGAFALRSAIAGDDTEDGATTTDRPSGDGGDPVTTVPDDVVLACDEDLGAVCDALGAEAVRASEVLAAAEEGDLPWDAWLTLDGMGGVLRSTRIEAGLDPLVTDPVAVASSPLALLALDEPPGGCDDDPAVVWTCLMDPPEPFLNGVAIPSADTSLGTLVLAAAATGALGGTGFDRFDVQGTPEGDAVTALLRDSPSGAGPTSARQTSAMFNPGVADAAVTTLGLATLQARTPRGGNRGFRALDLDPRVVAGVALVGLGPDGEAAVRALRPAVTDQTVADALAEAGWAGEAAATSGLPEADVIYGVREDLGR